MSVGLAGSRQPGKDWLSVRFLCGRSEDTAYNVVVVPHIQQHRWGAGTPCHHETCKVRNSKVRLYIDSCIDDEAHKGQKETKSDERETPAGIIGRKGQDQQHDGSRDIRRYGMKIRLDRIVAKPLHYLR